MSLEEFAARFEVDTEKVPLPILEREMLRHRLHQLDGTTAQFLWGEEADFLVPHIHEGHRVKIVGRVLTRLATDTQEGGSITKIDLFRDEETRPAVSAVSMLRELPDNSTENAGFVVNEEGHILDADSRKISPLMQTAINECKLLFGAGSEAYKTLAYPPENLNAAFDQIRANTGYMLPPDELERVLGLMQSALEEQRSNLEPAEEERPRLQRLSAFVLSMS